MQRNGIYYGWVIVAIAFVSALLTTCSTLYSFGIFTHPISGEFGLSRSTFNIGFILFSIATGCYAPIIGNLLDKISLRRIMMMGAVFLGTSLIVISRSMSLLLDAVMVAGPLTLGFVMCGTLPGYVLVARWFDARRGRAMAIAGLGQSASGIIGTPVVAALLQHLGWRPSMLTIGIFVGIVLFLLALLARNRPPEGLADAPRQASLAATAKAEIDGQVWPVAALLRSSRFWLLFVAVSLVMSVVSTLMVTLVPYGIEQGLSPVIAATLISWVGLSGIIAKFVLIFIADRFDRSKLMAIGALVLAAFNLALAARPPYGLLLPTCVIAGFSIGTAYPLIAAIAADRFGTRSYGTVMGLLSPGISFGTAVASRFIGVVFDKTGTYTIAFGTFVSLLIVSAGLLLWSSRGPRRPVATATLAAV